jgi:hypothetical protein
MAAGFEGDDAVGRSMWSSKSIQEMTADELVIGIGYVRTSAADDKALLRALNTELSLRQAGIRVRPTPLDDAPCAVAM